MKKVIFADREEEYIRSLSNYTESKLKGEVEIYTYTDEERIIDLAQNNEGDIYIISFDIYEELKGEFSDRKKTIILSEDKNENLYFKYQPARNIVYEIKRRLDVTSFSKNKNVCNITGVYCLYDKRKNTDFTIGLGQIMAEGERTLWINMMEFSGFKYIAEGQGGNLSDLMYMFLNNGEVIEALEDEYVGKIGRLSYISPVSYIQDIRDIDFEIWRKLINEIAIIWDYKNVIILFDNMISNFLSALNICEKIYMISPEDTLNKAILKEFIDYILMLEREDIIDKVITVKMPEYTEIMQIEGYEKMSDGILGKWIRKILLEME